MSKKVNDGRTGKIASRPDGIYVKLYKDDAPIREFRVPTVTEAGNLVEYWEQTGIIDDSKAPENQ